MFTFTIIAIILIFMLDLSLALLNYKNRRAEIPKNVSDIYDEKDYKNWLDYTMEGFRLNIIQKIFNLTLLLVFIFLGVFNKLAEITEGLSNNTVIQTLLFLLFYLLFFALTSISFSYYQTFSIEERYGFNKSSLKTFICDEVKTTLILILVMGPLLYIVLNLFLSLGSVSMFYGWVIFMVILITIKALYSKVFLKMGNTLTPIEDGALKDKLTKLTSELGFEASEISVMDVSKRTTKMNAYFSGIGKFKSIILTDTLIEKCSTDEIISATAHEMGHCINRDWIRTILGWAIQYGIYMIILGFLLSSETFSTSFGFTGVHMGFCIVLFFVLIKPINILINIPLSYLSRRAEFKADSIAVTVGYGDSLINTLKLSSRESFLNLTPHPLVVKLTYFHPPLSERVDALEKYSEGLSI